MAIVADSDDAVYCLYDGREALTLADLKRCAALISKYQDLDLGLSDASVVAVAERIGTDRILTVDLRDFRAIRSARGKSFKLLPANGRGEPVPFTLAFGCRLEPRRRRKPGSS